MQNYPKTFRLEEQPPGLHWHTRSLTMMRALATTPTSARGSLNSSKSWRRAPSSDSQPGPARGDDWEADAAEARACADGETHEGAGRPSLRLERERELLLYDASRCRAQGLGGQRSPAGAHSLGEVRSARGGDSGSASRSGKTDRWRPLRSLLRHMRTEGRHARA